MELRSRKEFIRLLRHRKNFTNAALDFETYHYKNQYRAARK
ncbi:N-acetylneuraminate transporter, sodium-glucose/galactose cotransporter [Salmonella enterica subsp. enterica serovar Typhi str. P-stx-12]|nr:N-acetylneuraminate transporter, sodium-glucose/galactose cotransporter [Salmonella enterica subsp. enterica serovar Typhi str. P-stx-12]AXR54755.1 putative n-acetylneuraminate transporter, sodium-glucose/galactose cotransporter [Salmonella enterica subsp. enterica serovar Typhi]